MKKYIILALLSLQPFTYGARHHHKKATRKPHTPQKTPDLNLKITTILPTLLDQAIMPHNPPLSDEKLKIFIPNLFQNIKRKVDKLIKEKESPIEDKPLFLNTVFAYHTNFEYLLKKNYGAQALITLDRIIALYMMQLKIKQSSVSQSVLKEDLKKYNTVRAQLLSGATFADLTH